MKHLLHDVKIAFTGGQCSLTSHVCKNMSVLAIRKKKVTEGNPPIANGFWEKAVENV